MCKVVSECRAISETQAGSYRHQYMWVYQTLYGIVLYVWRGRKVKVTLKYHYLGRSRRLPPCSQNHSKPMSTPCTFHLSGACAVAQVTQYGYSGYQLRWVKFLRILCIASVVRDLSSWNWDSPPVGSCPGPGFACPACCAPSGTSRPKIHLGPTGPTANDI